MTGLEALAPTIAMLAALALAWFGARLVVRRETRTKGALMLVMVVVLIGNVAVWPM